MSTSIWKADPNGNIWNEGENWDADQVPSTSANFAASSKTAISFSSESAALIEQVRFHNEAPSFTFSIENLTTSPALTFTGAGVVNNSQKNQSFAVTSLGTYNQPQLKFIGSSSAGNSQMSYYAGPPSLEESYGGGTIAFHENATAGTAAFTVRTGKKKPINNSSTLGGQITFSERSSAGKATFSIFGTLGTDGDTFANAVFHDTASADQATFTNQGGTVPGGDGGNTQFYDNSTAAQGIYLNHGGSAYDTGCHGANGGDVAFDGLATGGTGQFNNYPASLKNANGGVTSFNNNPNYPPLAKQGASAGHGTYLNYGASTQYPGGGGHTEFTARYGFATADHATIYNFGSDLPDAFGAGHTSFSIGSPYASKKSGGEKSDPVNAFFPTASNATIWNFPGASGGFTVFKVFDGVVQKNQPTAGDAVIHNLAADTAGLAGGYTAFQDTTSAGNATLIAYGGSSGGQGGQITFSDTATGDTARIRLIGNGTLDAHGHTGGLCIGGLETSEGIVKLPLLRNQISLTMSDALVLNSARTSLILSVPDDSVLEPGHNYAVLRAPNLNAFTVNQFGVNSFPGAAPNLTLEGDVLSLIYTILD